MRLCSFLGKGRIASRALWSRTAICLLACCLVPAARGGDARIESAIDQYTAAIETKDRNQRLETFERAAQLFRQVIDGDAEHPPVLNAELYVNLGNAALQAEQIGPAIAAYRRALALDPANAQARQNLAYARSLLPDWIRHEDTSRLIDTLFFWRTMFSRDQVFLFAAFCFLAAAILLGISSAKNQPVLRNLAIIPLLAWIIAGGSLWLDYKTAVHYDVVVIHETRVYTADSENSSPRLSRPLPSGAELELLQQRDRWSEVHIPGAHTGWVLTSAIEQVVE